MRSYLYAQLFACTYLMSALCEEWVYEEQTCMDWSGRMSARKPNVCLMYLAMLKSTVLPWAQCYYGHKYFHRFLRSRDTVTTGMSPV